MLRDALQEVQVVKETAAKVDLHAARELAGRAVSTARNVVDGRLRRNGGNQISPSNDQLDRAGNEASGRLTKLPAAALL
ncbi:hypothetical protein WJX81_007840 [Elliptochloris bilobata]|uniref:Uncharacterized protein n=1 Tax=Elliptochloris bilobata TaxID=381761 RepID=A0AAW1S904_9CHLO